MADASKADVVRAGMEMLGWTYDPAEWAEQIDRREKELDGRDRSIPFLRSLFYQERQPTWQLLDDVRENNWTRVLITSTGLLLESDTRFVTNAVFASARARAYPIVAAHPWRDEYRPLTLVKLVSSGWDALCLEFRVGTWAKVPTEVLPIPERLKADVEEVAEILWRKTLSPGDDDSRPPRWPQT